MGTIDARFRIDWPDFTLDVDLSLPGRGVTALFGHSGSGKTTLLRCIAGLERAPHGALQVGDEIWQGAGSWLPTHKRPIGYVFQEASLFDHLTVRGNLRYGRRRSAERDGIGLEQAIELLGIGHLLERRTQYLSGGERQRVSIARALAVNPRVLLMDEPLAALDLQRKQEILPYLERLHDELAIPLIYVSHSPDEVARLADYLVVLDNGKALASGPLAQTLSRLDLPVRLGEDASVILEGKVAEIDSRWHLMRIDFAGGSLWTSDQGLAIGRSVRVHVMASDVSLASEPGTSSIQNVLPGRVDDLHEEAHPGLVLVRVFVGETALLARLTRRAAAALDIRPGRELWAQVKSVALID